MNKLEQVENHIDMALDTFKSDQAYNGYQRGYQHALEEMRCVVRTIKAKPDGIT
jgi:hypothetical protein